VFLSAQAEVVKRFPGMRTAVLSNFYFLRFIAPALVSPKAFGLIDGLHLSIPLCLIHPTHELPFRKSFATGTAILDAD